MLVVVSVSADQRSCSTSGPVSTGMGDRDHLGIPSQPVLVSLAILPWVGAMSTGDGSVHRYGRNGKFCVTVGSVTRTAGRLA